PLARWCRLLPKDAAKMPESAWKLVFYTMSWSYSTYLLFFTSYSFFHDPPSVFYNWQSGMSVPADIAIAYLIQGSFYGHSIYATVYMDAWRKDSAVMVVHHIITLALICFSYAFRYHNVGILVLFLHDINDIQLDAEGGGVLLLNDVLSNMGSVSFSITWFWFRLYWFPLKVLYATCVSSLQSVPNIPFYFFFNTLLFTLLLMNIYWFLFIVVFVVKVLKVKEVNDVREYEEEEGGRAALREKNNKQDDAGHHNAALGKNVQNGVTKEKHL
ncbi:Ceramide synthase 1, partial [Dissostichus eleginoides]